MEYGQRFVRSIQFFLTMDLKYKLFLLMAHPMEQNIQLHQSPQQKCHTRKKRRAKMCIQSKNEIGSFNQSRR